MQVLFTADIPFSELKMMHPYDPENEGEEGRYFTIAEFYEEVRCGGFLIPHYDTLVNNALILPLGRAPEAAEGELNTSK